MSKIFGGEKGFFLKALSIGLSVLTLSQFSVGAVPPPVARSKTRRGRKPRQAIRVRQPKQTKQPNIIVDAIKKHPVVAGILITSPFWGYALYKSVIWACDKYGPVTAEKLNKHLEDCWKQLNMYNEMDTAQVCAALVELSVFLGESRSREEIRSICESLQNIEIEIDRLHGVVTQRMVSAGNATLQQALTDIDNNLLAIKFGLHKGEIPIRDSRSQNLQFDTTDGGHGTTYVQNMITRTAISDDRAGLGRKFNDLCLISGYTAGQDCGRDNRLGWEMSAYEYYFATSSKYDELDYDKQVRFGKIITLLHAHRNEEAWRPLIESAMALFSAHGNHCSWRATALIDQVYQLLNDLILQNGLDDAGAAHHNQLDIMFSDLKDKFVAKTRAHYLDTDLADAYEPLNELNFFTAYMEWFLNMTHERPNIWDYHRIPDSVSRICAMYTSKEKLFKIANAAVVDRYHDENTLRRIDAELFRDVNDMQMSFSEYCDWVGKTRENMERFVDAIQASGSEELQTWALDRNTRLPVSRIYDLTTAEIANVERKGCPEMVNWYGVKFVHLLRNNGYFMLR